MESLYPNESQNVPVNKRKTTKILNSEDEMWRFSYLKQQISGNGKLDDKFKSYVRNIKHAYLTLFMLLQACVSTTHFIVIIIYYIKMDSDILEIIPDMVSYLITSIIPFIGIFLTESYVKRHPHVLKLVSGVAFVTLYIIDCSLPLYHHFINEVNTKPSFGSHLVMSCYIFFTIQNNLMALVLGASITCSQLLLLNFITYHEHSSEERWILLGSDIIHYSCLNGVGLYFRYIYEFVERKGFLDRRACVENNRDLKFMKDQEEQLLLSILPRNFIEEFRKDIITHKNKILKPKPFESRFLMNYENVTILYADIVNYTFMTTQLTPASKLVETLNDLFGSFDEVSEELKVLRIKFLGDCYYCVGGLPPESIKNHADACVQLGLKMIQIIKRVRENRDLNIDMRIGIHTGSIIGGIIGMLKWQFDVWSKDVFIANRMETTGTPGKVHITKQTKDQLEKVYNIEATATGQRDSMLSTNEIETFLISPVADSSSTKTIVEKYKRITSISVENSTPRRPSGHPNLDRRFSGNPNLEKRSSGHLLKDRRTSGNPILESNYRTSVGDIKRRTAFMDNNSSRYQEKLEETDKELMEVIDAMPVTKKDQWLNQTEIRPFFLTYKNLEKEKWYIKQADPLFKYCLLELLIIVIGIILISDVLDSYWHLASWLELTTLLVIIFGLLPLSWMRYFYNSYVIKNKMSITNSSDDGSDDSIQYFDDLSETSEGDKYKNYEPKSKFLLFYYKAAQFINLNFLIRLFIYFCISGMFAICFFLELFECNRNLKSSSKDDNSNCLLPWQMTRLCGLTIILNFIFFRIHLWLKWFFSVIVASVYIYFISYLSYDYFMESERYNYLLPAPVSHILYVLYLTFTLHIINRQTDYLNRLDFNWNLQLIKEEDEASDKREINYRLLKNILPIHVAEIYLNLNRKKELYYREYKRVAVMFASIVNYDKDELDPYILLQLMDQMISDFDEILLSKDFNGNIEKIKVINWTFMAAAGLNPDNNQHDQTIEEENDTFQKYLILIVKFAVKIMKALEKISGESNQDYDIRIGICYGEVIAGVVGSKKPLYDIWGDTVNMASRMDSTGVPGKIQITKDTASVLEKHGIQCEFRDFIFVKGKSEKVPTYYISLDHQKNLKIIQKNPE